MQFYNDGCTIIIINLTLSSIQTVYRIVETLESIKFGESAPRMNWRVLNLAA